MITRIEATHYRCFDKVDVELASFRVVVGANGAGKTTLLDIPVLLGDLLRARGVASAFTEKKNGRAPRAGGLLRRHIHTHSRALVVLDQQFGAELPAAQVQRNIESRLTANGWQHRHAVFVIDPELEVLLGQDNPNVDRLLRHRRTPGLRAELAADWRWPADASKPPAPKDFLLSIIRNNRAGAPIAAYSKIAGTVSVAGCVDPAFHGIKEAICGWFPKEAP